MRTAVNENRVLVGALGFVGFWIVVLGSVPMGLCAGAAYIALAVLTGTSALRHRRSGWVTGAFFAALLIPLPAWVGAMILLFDLLGIVPR